MEGTMEPPAPNRKSKDLPFYAAPDHVQTSSRIIREARISLSRTGLKAINTTMRPDTPQEGQRQLFGDTSIRDQKNRPPSAFSLGSRHFESESRPVSGTKVRLDPIDHKPRTPQHSDSAEVVAPRPPADPNRPIRRSGSRQRLQQSVSIDTSPSNSYVLHGRSGSLQDVSDISYRTSPSSVPTTPESQRRVRSGPKERTRSGSMGENRSVSPADPGSRSNRNGHTQLRDQDGLENGYVKEQYSKRGGDGTVRDSSHHKREGSGRTRREGSGGNRDRQSQHNTGRKEGSGEAHREGSTGTHREGSAGTHREGSAGAHREGSAGTHREGSGGRHKEHEASVGLGSKREVSNRASSGGRQGSAGRREEETVEEAQYYNTHIAPIVEDLVGHYKDRDPSTLLELSDRLYDALEEGNLLGKNCRRRSHILKVVFKMLDIESPHLLLKQARLILSLRVSGNNLLNVCKLTFKVSREKRNDNYFLEANLLDLLIDTVRTTDHGVMPGPEALVYCLGAIKFLSGNATIVKHLVKRGVIEAMAKLLCSINQMMGDTGKPSEQSGHILVQLTGAMRNCAEVSGTRIQFLEHGVLEELCQIMELFLHDGDLIMNISRLFSKLTTHIDCCRAVGRSSNFKAFTHALNKHMKNPDLVVRITFTLGNLTAKSESSRKKLFAQSRAFDTLLAVFKYYFNELDLKKREGQRDGSPEKSDAREGLTIGRSEDILVKVVRVIANLSINEDIGPVIASNETCVMHLIRVLEVHDLQNNEELVLNTIATINNLSYYTSIPGAIASKQLDIAKVLLNFLDVNHMEGLAEATRVLGNLSREKPVRELLFSKKVMEMMIAMLDSGDRETVFTACGVLINLMADQDKRRTLKKHGGIMKLIEVLRDFARSDWQLASMVCQTLWNYSGKITSTNSCFGETEAAELNELLIEYLDEEAALDPSLSQELDEEMRDYTQHIWETEFCPVATRLLERVEAHQSEFEPLEHPL